MVSLSKLTNWPARPAFASPLGRSKVEVLEANSISFACKMFGMTGYLTDRQMFGMTINPISPGIFFDAYVPGGGSF